MFNFGLIVFVALSSLKSQAQMLPQQVGDQEMPSLAPIIDQVAPAVVNISVQGSVEVNNQLSQDPFFRRFLPPDTRREVQSAGSGVIVDAENGYILTNHHVIENADEITVALIDERTLDATVVGSDSGSDIAVLKVEPDDLLEMPLGNSDGLRVGDFVVAIGNPFRLRHTVTSGIVSGLGRTGINPEGYEDFIQTDASINPGNSGGALVNLKGELVGVNSAIFSRTGGNIGIGFAIPVNMARSVMDQLVAYGAVRRGLLGVSIATVTPDIAESYDLEDTSGALVTAVGSGSAAEAAGLAIGDVIIGVDGQSIEDPSSLRNAIGLMRPGDAVIVSYVREGNVNTASATLGELQAAAVQTESERLSQVDPVFEGAVFETNGQTRTNFNGVTGILAVQVEQGSSAFLRGLRTGDIITHINRQRVETVSAASDIIEDARSIILQVSRDNRGVLILMR
ncbi:MAG: serine endoprotease DegQ [Rhodospirillaceae bacterium]|nr:serine endoprotease DegQ [Rhodospirillaceae bacterium]|tara:strand:+ start:11754 stop:13112 length:1359 start_codon:yes stop_codon:yes gene_type:complete